VAYSAGEADGWGPWYLKFNINSNSDPDFNSVQKLGSRAPKIKRKLWDDRICKDEQLFPSEILRFMMEIELKIWQVKVYF
jgi:hypothetical protein